MATYAIGDIQGCYEPLQRLLEKAGFDPAVDRLWLCGDLVNRGPSSLEVLRWAAGQGDRVVSVLGNHDLHLLARAEGLRPARADDTMDAVLEAEDRTELLDWLGNLPFAHRDDRWMMVHAGLLPQWSFEQAISLADEATAALRSDRRGFLQTIYGRRPPWRWSDSLAGPDRLRCVVAALTRARGITPDGTMDDDFTGPPEEAPAHLTPWFDAPSQRDRSLTVICGHWAALGLLVRTDVVALDTGCVWGGSLSAFRLEDGAVFQVSPEA